MKLNDLHNTKGARKKRKIIGRGDGSGSGGTAGRGHKGQKARAGANMRPFFEGGQIPLFRRLPKRGFKHAHKIYNIINLSVIDANFAVGDRVDEDILRAKGLVGSKISGLKILANGEISKAITIVADKFSESAKTKIESAGGKCEGVSANA